MSDRPPSQAKSSSGRETSFGLPTSGYRGWMPVLLKDGSASKKPPQEGYKNVVTNQEYTPPGGWNDPPPGPTGEPVRQASDAYRRGWEQIKWNSAPELTDQARQRYESLVKAGLIHPEETDNASSQ